MPSLIRQGASVTASILETAAGLLRKLAETEDASPRAEERTADEPRAPQPAPSTATASKPRPAPATRTRISNPKAARKVRSRQS
jgi:hypothetical protein